MIGFEQTSSIGKPRMPHPGWFLGDRDGLLRGGTLELGVDGGDEDAQRSGEEMTPLIHGVSERVDQKNAFHRDWA